jgi:protein-disulfide isomerase
MATLHVPVNSADQTQGDAFAPVTLVEYGDYECPACGAAFPVVKAVQRQFGTKLRFVFRNFPLTKLHPHAESAAEVAEFAGAHGRFWEMHDALYENQAEFGVPLYLALAESLGLSPVDLREALETHSFRPKVRRDFSGGIRSGVNGTPTFFINGTRHDGAFEVEALVAAITAALEHATLDA